MTVFELLQVAWDTAEQARPSLGLGLGEGIVCWRTSMTVTSLGVSCQTRVTALKENCMVLGQ